MSTKRERILPDYTRQGKSTIPSRWSTAENTVYKTEHLCMNKELHHGNTNIQITLESSTILKESINATLDGKIIDECQDRNEFIDFYLKIPPKELRLKRENSKERLQGFLPLNEKTTKKKGRSIIERLLSDVDRRVLSDSFQVNVIQCHKSNRSL